MYVSTAQLVDAFVEHPFQLLSFMESIYSTHKKLEIFVGEFGKFQNAPKMHDNVYR